MKKRTVKAFAGETSRASTTTNVLTPADSTNRFSIMLFSYKHDISIANHLFQTRDDAKMRDGQVVAAFHPIKKVDPKGVYCFVMDENNTYSVLKNRLEPITMHTIVWKRKTYMTHSDELVEQIRLTREFVGEYLRKQAAKRA